MKNDWIEYNFLFCWASECVSDRIEYNWFCVYLHESVCVCVYVSSRAHVSAYPAIDLNNVHDDVTEQKNKKNIFFCCCCRRRHFILFLKVNRIEIYEKTKLEHAIILIASSSSYLQFPQYYRKPTCTYQPINVDVHHTTPLWKLSKAIIIPIYVYICTANSKNYFVPFIHLFFIFFPP